MYIIKNIKLTTIHDNPIILQQGGKVHKSEYRISYKKLWALHSY